MVGKGAVILLYLLNQPAFFFFFNQKLNFSNEGSNFILRNNDSRVEKSRKNFAVSRVRIENNKDSCLVKCVDKFTVEVTLLTKTSRYPMLNN